MTHSFIVFLQRYKIKGGKITHCYFVAGLLPLRGWINFIGYFRVILIGH